MRISDWSSDVCSSDLRLSRDDPESNLTHLPCYRRIVFFSKITRNDGPKNWVKTGLQLLRQGSHLLRHIINADDTGRGEKAQYCKIEPARTPFHPIGGGGGHILPCPAPQVYGTGAPCSRSASSTYHRHNHSVQCSDTRTQHDE